MNRKFDHARGYERNPNRGGIQASDQGQNGDLSSWPKQKALTRPADEACRYNPIAAQVLNAEMPLN